MIKACYYVLRLRGLTSYYITRTPIPKHSSAFMHINCKMYSKDFTLTSTISVAKIRESPNISQPHSVPHTGQHEVQLPTPCLSLIVLENGILTCFSLSQFCLFYVQNNNILDNLGLGKSDFFIFREFWTH